MNPSITVSSSLTDEMVLAALNGWHDDSSRGSPLAHLLLYRREQERGSDIRQASNAVLQAGMDRIAEGAPELTAIVQARFQQGLAGYQIAACRHMAEGTVWRKQREAIRLLRQTLLELESAAWSAQLKRFHGRFEVPTYSRLFGIDRHLHLLVDRISRPGVPWLIAVEGIGGIGKTALVDALARRLLASGQWQDFAWITARQRVFQGGTIRAVDRAALTVDEFLDSLMQQLIGDQVSAATLTSAQKQALLKHRLKLHPHLIVVDNLETAPQLDALLVCLREMAGPSKFLLTSRHSHAHAPDIFHFVMPELPLDSALALLRAEASNRNVSGLIGASDRDLHPVYRIVGGNPLALRLVVGQLQTQSLHAVLDGLRWAEGRSATQLYTYIYRRMWDELDEQARRVLLMMPLLTERGGDLVYLSAMAARVGLSDQAMREGVSRLVERNLIDCQGDTETQRYTIHSLTRAFLQRQVLQWSDQRARVA